MVTKLILKVFLIIFLISNFNFIARPAKSETINPNTTNKMDFLYVRHNDEKKPFKRHDSKTETDSLVSLFINNTNSIESNATDTNKNFKSIAEDALLAQLENRTFNLKPNVEISIEKNNFGNSEFSISTIQPIFKSKENSTTYFLQGSLMVSDDGDRKTSNLGFGYRKLFNQDNWLFGVNMFLDYEIPYDHKRASAGVELKSLPLEINTNYYKALTSWRVNNNGFLERGYDGYDAEIGLQVPFIPSSRVFGKIYTWDNVYGSANVEGVKYSLLVSDPKNSGWRLELKHDDNNINNSTRSIELTYRLELDPSSSRIEDRPIISTQAYDYNSMQNKLLEKVRRENLILKEIHSTSDISSSETGLNLTFSVRLGSSLTVTDCSSGGDSISINANVITAIPWAPTNLNIGDAWNVEYCVYGLNLANDGAYVSGDTMKSGDGPYYYTLTDMGAYTKVTMQGTVVAPPSNFGSGIVLRRGSRFYGVSSDDDMHTFGTIDE